jgi:8-oxo-dGTP pyrophosphatase MutT (NUDIX family)
MEVSIGFIEQDGTYLLQRRPNNPEIGAAGLIGAFGGRRELGESSVEAVCREMNEETSLSPSPEDFSYLGSVEVVAYKQDEPLHISAEVFKISIKQDEAVEAREGKIVRLTADEAINSINHLTPATRAAFEELL